MALGTSVSFRSIVVASTDGLLERLLCELRRRWPAGAFTACGLADVTARLPDPLVDIIFLCVPGPGMEPVFSGLAGWVERAQGAAVVAFLSEPDPELELALIGAGIDECRALSRLADLHLEAVILRRRRTWELQQANRQLRNFSHLLAHELRSPLANLAANADYLVRAHGPKFEPEVGEILDQCGRRVREMSNLISQILVFTETGMHGDVDPVDTTKLLAQVSETLVATEPDLRGHLSWSALPTVLSNPLVLAAVFRNLLAVAVKLRRPGTGIHVAGWDGGSHWIFKMRYVGELWELPSLDVRPATARGISGRLLVGLYFARQTIERMGGRLWSEPAPEGGALAFLLPKTTPM